MVMSLNPKCYPLMLGPEFPEYEPHPDHRKFDQRPATRLCVGKRADESKSSAEVAVDGGSVMVASRWIDARQGRRGELLSRGLLNINNLASLAANITVADPTAW